MLGIEATGTVTMLILLSKDGFIMMLAEVIPLLSHNGTTPLIIPHEEIAILDIL
jgi:hypothetical protein